MTRFDPDKHPRDSGGKFAEKPEVSTGVSLSETPACTCTWHNEPRGGGYYESWDEPDPHCLVHGVGSNGPDALEAISQDPDLEVRYLVAQNDNTNAKTLANLASDPEQKVRNATIFNQNTPRESIQHIADNDPSPDLRRNAHERLNPTVPLTAEQLNEKYPPTDEDYAEALEREVERASGAFDWDRLMGRGTRRTEKNKEMYQRLLMSEYGNRDDVKSKAAKLARINAELKAPLRAWLDGVPTELDEHLDRMWVGEDGGQSEEEIRQRLSEERMMLDDLRNGRIKPTDIVGRSKGYRNNRRVAEEYLESSIDKNELALKTRGRSLSVNVANAQSRVRKAAQ